MSKAPSVDLRTRVLAAVAAGATHREAGLRFGVSAASVSRWRRLEREKGDVRPGPLGGDRRSGRIEAQAALVLGLLAVKANQPTLRAEVEAAFAEAARAKGDALETYADLDKGHGRIEERRAAVLRDTGWLQGDRRFPGELRLPGAACLVRAQTRVEARGATRTETRYFISSRALSAADAAAAIRDHWAIENRLHWVLDVTFADDHSRLRRGHGARNMATVRHFALNLVRGIADKRSIKSRRKVAGWDPNYLDAILSAFP